MLNSRIIKLVKLIKFEAKDGNSYRSFEILLDHFLPLIYRTYKMSGISEEEISMKIKDLSLLMWETILTIEPENFLLWFVKEINKVIIVNKTLKEARQKEIEIIRKDLIKSKFVLNIKHKEIMEHLNIYEYETLIYRVVYQLTIDEISELNRCSKTEVKNTYNKAKNMVFYLMKEGDE